MAPLPPGPTAGPFTQATALHRDPLAFLQAQQRRHGDLFTLRLPTARPLVVATDPAAVGPLIHGDPQLAHAGEARRRILPQASPRSSFGGDGAQHQAARAHLATAFDPGRVDAQRDRIEAITAAHVAVWPTGRPFRLLPRMRLIADDVAARVLLGVRDDARATALARAIGRMLWTPGNPPLSPPGEGDGLLGALGAREGRRRMAPVQRLLAAELDERRARGDTDGDDALACLLRTEPPLSSAEAIDELLPVLMAAQEPMAAALTWLLERLAREAPEHAERFVIGEGDDPMREAIVKESLRLRPPALAMLRRLQQPMTIDGQPLPAGVSVAVPILALHHDLRAFAAPEAFRPQRWLAPDPPEAHLHPFGAGARRCLGEPLAHAEIGTVVPAVLRRVRLRPAWPRPEKMVLRATILVPHRSGLVVARPR